MQKGLPLKGANPTMLYGYGGFSVSTLPSYRSDVPAWLEMGGIWVTANMRGGAEYGEAWHKAGVANGGTSIEDPPGVRANGAYLAYLRDPDGNKIVGVARPAG